MSPSDPLRRPPPPIAPDAWGTFRKIHLMGICGSAMGALAAMLSARGYEVRGSDAAPYPPMSDFLAARGIPVMKGYEDARVLDWAPDLVVVGNVIRPTYAEALAMRERGLPHASLPEALASLFLGERVPIVVTGTHGKTTTASMTAWLLERAGLAPSFFIGGVAGNWQSNHHLGPGAHMVIEGDEYDTAFWDRGAKFFHYRPRLASINNLEMDHADIFADVDAIERTFTRFASLVPPDGRLIVPAHEARARRAAETSPAPRWLTAIEGDASDDADLVATAPRFEPDGTRFSLALPAELGHAPVAIHLPLPGRHNVYNALVAAGLALAAGADPATFSAAFASFVAPLKRLSLVGEAAGIPVIDDFAHHPSAIAATIDAVRQRYPGRRLVALFEAQSNTARRKVFQRGFADALARADKVWFKRSLDKASDPLPPEARLDLAELCQSLVARGVPATLVPEVAALADAVVADARPDEDVLLVMSGRDFEGVHRLLLERLASMRSSLGETSPARYARPMPLLERSAIIEALKRLDEELGARGVKADLFLVGGAVMCLAHQARPSTRDVDGWFTEPEVVRRAAAVVARDLGLPSDWLNDAAKGFVPAGAGFELWRSFEHLTVSVADARTLLAMKAAAARSEVDRDDLRFLARHLGLRTADEALAIVTSYFPEDRLPVRTRLILEELFDDGA